MLPFCLKALPKPLGDNPFPRKFTGAVLQLIELGKDAPKPAFTNAKSYRRHESIWWQRHEAANSEEHSNGTLCDAQSEHQEGAEKERKILTMSTNFE
jgi:hypothetical protein